jgi:hypothetical protein
MAAIQHRVTAQPAADLAELHWPPLPSTRACWCQPSIRFGSAGGSGGSAGRIDVYPDALQFSVIDRGYLVRLQGGALGTVEVRSTVAFRSRIAKSIGVPSRLNGYQCLERVGDGVNQEEVPGHGWTAAIAT